jgi:alpha-galactosidase
MVDATGNPVTCEKVWISYFTGGRDNRGEGYGKLTAGYGSRRVPAEMGEKIGPEFAFGIYTQKALAEPILIIKTAWGGKSLHTDFRPPSAGPYVFNENELENFKRRGKDIKEVKADKAEKSGKFYRLMMDHVKMVLSDIKRVYPGYNQKDGFELSGFAWFQGWNDMVASGTYPNRGQPGGYDAYTDCLAHFYSRCTQGSPGTEDEVCHWGDGSRGTVGKIYQSALCSDPWWVSEGHGCPRLDAGI